MVASACGTTPEAQTILKTKTVTSPPITHTVTVTRTPKSCKTALYMFRRIGNTELKVIKQQYTGDITGATATIKKASALVSKVRKPYIACLIG
jgi:hypothetical protein